MSGHTPEEIHHHVKIYIRVFIALAALTLVTVGVSYIKLPMMAAILLALFIATIKSSLVAAFFMHLVNEKKIIYWILIPTFAFFLVLLILISYS